MSTRANIIVKDNFDTLFFYRHSDGYPEGTAPTLNKLMKWLKEGKIRDNTGQFSGWLILIGAMEYNTLPEFKTEKNAWGIKEYGDVETIADPKDWKASAYEPTAGIHGDIDYLYIIDLENKTLECFEDWTDKGIPKGENILKAETTK